VKFEESYYGHRIIVTTIQRENGTWSSKAELFASGKKSLVQEIHGNFSSEEEAKRNALSTATNLIDRTRITKGKP
jgi:hypothetical protein